MTRLLVVSRNAALAIGLTMAEYDVVDVRPAGNEPITTPDEAVDAVVLDLEDASASLAVLEQLRAQSDPRPTLMVSSDKPGWAQVTGAAPEGVIVLPSPVSRQNLLLTLDRLLAPPPEPAVGPPPAEPNRRRFRGRTTEAPPGPPPVSSEPRLPPPPPPADPEPAPAVIAAPSVPVSARPAPKAPEPAASQASLPAVRETPRRLPAKTAGTAPKPGSTARNAAPATAASAAAATATSAGATAPPMTANSLAIERSYEPVELVRELTRRVEGLYSVPEVAAVTIAEAVERTASEAGALLLPDGGVWRASGGVALRPIERRIQLDADHWLISEVARSQHGIIIEDTDIARQRLHGAPLAAWEQLLVAPIPALAGVILVARHATAYDEHDLAGLAALAAEAAPIVDRAMEVRRLARMLAPLRDPAD